MYGEFLAVPLREFTYPRTTLHRKNPYSDFSYTVIPNAGTVVNNAPAVVTKAGSPLALARIIYAGGDYIASRIVIIIALNMCSTLHCQKSKKANQKCRTSGGALDEIWESNCGDEGELVHSQNAKKWTAVELPSTSTYLKIKFNF